MTFYIAKVNMAFKIILSIFALVAAANAAICSIPYPNNPLAPGYIDSCVPAIPPRIGCGNAFVRPALACADAAVFAPACADVVAPCGPACANIVPAFSTGCCDTPFVSAVAPSCSPCNVIPRCAPLVTLDPPTCGVNPAVALTLTRFGLAPTVATPDGLVVNGVINNGCGRAVAAPFAL